MEKIFKALSVTIRLRIINFLSSGELCVCDLVELLNLPQSTVSRHLSVLKEVKIISDRRTGKWIHYQLSFDLIKKYPGLNEIINLIGNDELYQQDLDRLKLYQKNKKQNC